MVPSVDPRLFDGLSVYQDVVLAGRTVRRGVRDCGQRWALIEPHMPRTGTVLDIGSNFGWFGLKICETRPDCVVASVEADPRSALVQRQVLASHEHRRIALLTARADARLVSRFAAAGQRFDAALCLSILHWLPDHRLFLSQLGQISARIVIEYPEPDEPDAGDPRIRAEIGAIDEYLRRLFPTRQVEQVGDCASHLSSLHRRSVWLVGAASGSPTKQQAAMYSNGLAVAGLLDNGLSWPPRSWWLAKLNRMAAAGRAGWPRPQQLVLSSLGLEGLEEVPRQLAARLHRLPEDTLYPRGGRLQRHLRQMAGRFARRVLAPLVDA